MEFRRVFDTIPDQFDRWRPKYCPALFAALTAAAELDPGREVLELGPGTGQATEPILQTGCNYLGIELGEHLAALMRQKFGAYANFSLVCDDFLTHDFGGRRFDLICSAATIQWLPEEAAFRKTYALLKPGGMLAMLLTRTDYTSNEALWQRIQAVYAQHFHPKEEYTYHGGFRYERAVDYGYVDFCRSEFPGERVLTAEEYCAQCATHCDHIFLPEPERTAFFDGLRHAVLDAGDRIVLKDTYVMMTARRPQSAGADVDGMRHGLRGQAPLSALC